MSKLWIESITGMQDLVLQKVHVIPKGERLEVKDLNEFLRKIDETKAMFLFMMEIHGFKVEKQLRKEGE